MKDGFRFFVLPALIEEKIFLILSGAIAFSIPFKASFNSLFCILLFIFWLLFTKKKIDPSRIDVIGMISILFWIAVVGMLYTQNLEEGLFRFQQKSLLLVLPLVFFTSEIEWRKHISIISSIFIYGVLFACIFCLIEASYNSWMHSSGEYFFSEKLARSSIVDLYPYILALLCFSSALLLTESCLGKFGLHFFLTARKIAVPLTCFLIMFILLLGVKQIIIALIIFLFLYAIRIHKRIIYFLVVGVLVIITSVIYFSPILKTRLTEVVNEKNQENALDQNPTLGTPLNGIALRRALWVCAVDVIKENLWIGVGSGDGQDELQKSYQKREFVFAANYNRFNAHNQYLQVAINFGLIGLVIWIASFGWLFYQFKTNWLFISALGLFLFSMLTESMLETNKGALAMAFVLTLLATETNCTASKSNEQHG